MVCTSVLLCLAPSCGPFEFWPSDSFRRTLSSESMDEAEFTEMPDAEVTDEREDWTIERA